VVEVVDETADFVGKRRTLEELNLAENIDKQIKKTRHEKEANP
jgi:hypothetical protein